MSQPNLDPIIISDTFDSKYILTGLRGRKIRYFRLQVFFILSSGLLHGHNVGITL